MLNDKQNRGMAPFYVHILILVGVVYLCRLVSMWGIPLGDSTEARYAEIARLMLTSHDWVRLMHYPGEYFWAKPPLSTWLSAMSMQIFGINALSARFPAWLLSFLSMVLVARMAKQQLQTKGMFWSIAILSTTFYFLLDAGTVMTDPALLTCVTIVMVSFWLRMQQAHWIWGYLAFVGWGLGLLAKGLVMGVFSVLPLMVWLTWERQWLRSWQLIPWIKGSLLTVAIALPWYILAEQRMPGFLSYFIVGEHIMRFIKPGWTGDMFGHAHTAPLGMIWIYFLAGTVPWSPLGLLWLKNTKSLKQLIQHQHAWISYLLCFCIMPLLVFTFARNIIYPYVFPVLPAFALLFTTLSLHFAEEKKMQHYFYGVAIVLAVLCLLATGLLNIYPKQFSKSTDKMIATWQHARQSPKQHLIYLHQKPEYSSMFYSQGEVLATRDQTTLCTWLKQGLQFVVLDSDQPCDYQIGLEKTSQVITKIQHRSRIDTLYQVKHLPEFCA